MDPIHALPSHLPLLGHVFVNNVANMADEDDILLFPVFHNPVGDRLENSIANRFLTRWLGLGISSAIGLGIGDHGDGEGAFRCRGQWNLLGGNGGGETG